MGRVTLELMPLELSLYHCNQFWKEKIDRISSMEKLKLLAVTGGVPRYLEEIDINLPAEQNIKNICFTREGFLFHEFEKIFNDIFKRRARIYKEIIFTLVSGSKTFSEIIALINLKKSGNIGKYLDNLVISGFLAKDISYSPKTGNASKLIKFRLKDNYLRFYLKYIDPLKEKINSGLFDDIEITNLLNCAPAMDHLARLWADNGQIVKAKKLILKTIKDYSHPHFIFEQTYDYILFKQGKDQAALKVLRKVIK